MNAPPEKENISQAYSKALEELKNIDSDVVLLLGQTGGGKSSIANTIIGDKRCNEGGGLRSVTSDCQIETVQWFGHKNPKVTVIDTPGFLDSERRDAVFLTQITSFLHHFPKNKLKVVVIILPLMETRAKSTYKDMIDITELLFGHKVWDHVMFVTTQQNQLAEGPRPDNIINEWKAWISDHFALDENQIKHCNYIYENPESLASLYNLFCEVTPFTPEVSEKMDTYLKSNPGASVQQTITEVENLSKVKAKFEDDMKKMKEEHKKQIEELRQKPHMDNADKVLFESLLKEFRILSEKVNALKTPAPVEIHTTESPCVLF